MKYPPQIIPTPLILSEYIICILAVWIAPLENPSIVKESLSALNDGRLRSSSNIKGILRNLYEIAHYKKLEFDGHCPIFIN